MRQRRLLIADSAAEKWFRNLLAGLTVAIVALPLALAFGIGSGLGAQAGLTTAIIAGALAALFGGSRLQVSGPTGAMTVVLIPIVSSFGPAAILQVGLMASGFLVLAAMLRLGRHIHKLPTSLIEGFTAGIAVVIALQQVAFVLGVELRSSDHIWQSVFEEIQSWFGQPQFTPILVGSFVALINIFGANRWPRLPLALITIVLATGVAHLLDLGLEKIGTLPSTIASPQLEFLNAGNWLALVPPSLAVAFLAGLESLLSAKIADRASGQEPHQPNRELFGQGIANLVVPFFGGVPATAALARTAVNVKAGASSRLAAVSHSVFLAIFVLLLSDLIAQVPLAALGGVLIATAYHMIRIEELRKTARQSSLDAAVLIITLLATVILDLISALLIGLVLYLSLKKTRLSRRTIAVDEEETLGD